MSFADVVFLVMFTAAVTLAAYGAAAWVDWSIRRDIRADREHTRRWS